MEPDKHETRVVLRRFKDDGSLIALFPDIREGAGMCSSYMHIGQHGTADKAISRDGATRPVKPEEPDAVALLAELRSIGYRPRALRRMPGWRN